VCVCVWVYVFVLWVNVRTRLCANCSSVVDVVHSDSSLYCEIFKKENLNKFFIIAAWTISFIIIIIIIITIIIVMIIIIIVEKYYQLLHYYCSHIGTFLCSSFVFLLAYLTAIWSLIAMSYILIIIPIPIPIPTSIPFSAIYHPQSI